MENSKIVADTSTDEDENYFSPSDEIKNCNMVTKIEGRIKQDFDNLRLKVDLKTESFIEILNSQRDELMDQINKFENNKIKRMKRYFNDEGEGKKSLEDLNSQMECLKMESIDFNGETFAIKLAKFNEQKNWIIQNNILFFHESVSNLNQKYIGYLNEIPNDNIIEKLKQVGLYEISYGFKYHEILDSIVSVSENGLLIAIGIRFKVYKSDLKNYSDVFLLTVYDHDKIKSQKQLDRYDYDKICLNDTILVLSCRPGIELYDVNSLKLVKSLQLESTDNIMNILIEKKLIYVFISRSHYPRPMVYLLNIFDDNLKHLGSRDMPEASNIFMRNQKIFSQKGYSIHMMNDDYGFLRPDFKIEFLFELVGITKSDEIIALNSNAQLILVYKIDGTFVNEFSIPHFDNNKCSIHMNGEGKCVINNKKKLKLYFN
jgi:hypothetical protein